MKRKGIINFYFDKKSNFSKIDEHIIKLGFKAYKFVSSVEEFTQKLKELNFDDKICIWIHVRRKENFEGIDGALVNDLKYRYKDISYEFVTRSSTYQEETEKLRSKDLEGKPVRKFKEVGYLIDNDIVKPHLVSEILNMRRKSKKKDKKSKIKNKIFISHSSKDKNLVDSFVKKILQLGLGINQRDIFCTSIEGRGVKAGKDIPTQLKEELSNSKLVFLIISQNYLKSQICLNEMGAAWVLLEEYRIISLKDSTISYSEIGYLSEHRLGLCLDKEDNLFQLFDDIKDIIKKYDPKSEALNKQVKEFLKQNYSKH